MQGSISDSLRTAIQRLNQEASLREIADAIGGVSYGSLHKLLHHRNLRPSTLRKIAQGLAGSRETAAADQLLDALQTLLKPLGVANRRRVEARLGRVIAEAFKELGRVPVWVRWLTEGKRSAPSSSESVRELLKEVQRGSRGGAKALRRR